MKNDNITLRSLEPEDLEVLYKWENDSLLWQFSNNIAPFSRYMLKEYISSSLTDDIFCSRQQRFMIVEKQSERAVGAIDLFDYEPIHRNIGLGMLIYEESDRGKGYGREAVNQVIEYCRQILDIHSIYCNILSDNDFCISLFEKCGFIFVGERKEWLNIDGKWHNEKMYQLIL
ncbi:MAG: GNAT family protein [Rikenellaceae bacterium]